MRAFTLSFGLICGLLFIYGFVFTNNERRDRLNITAAQHKRLLTVVIALPDVNSRYRWLSVYGCSADVTEAGVQCNGWFERESSTELDGQRKQHLFDWRDLPGGTMRVVGMAFDGDGKVLAQNQVTVFRQ